MTYFRVQDAGRDVNELLDPGYQFSHAWNGCSARTRPGVSVCDSLEDLALYLASGIGQAIRQAMGRGDWVIVEVEADEIPGSAPVDPEFESLVRPTSIVSVTPVGDAFLALLDEQDAFMASFVEVNFDDE